MQASAVRMSNESDGNWWIGAIAALSGFGGLVMGFLTRGWSAARAAGVADGNFVAWKTYMESQVTALKAQGDAAESRLHFRIASLEARKDRIDEMLQDVPRRDEVNDRFNQLTQQLTELSRSLHRGPEQR
jgi:hypothetical protein